MNAAFLLLIACALSGIVVPLPEDIALLAAGVTLADPATFPAMVLAGMLGLLFRDSVFFLLGHFVGESVLRWPMVKSLVGDERIRRGRALVERQGGRAVLVARFLIGARTAAFLVSGAMGVRVREFYLWNTTGLAVSVPLWLLLGYAVGEPVVSAMTWLLDHQIWMVAGLIVVVGCGLGLRWRRNAAKLEGSGAAGVDPADRAP